MTVALPVAELVAVEVPDAAAQLFQRARGGGGLRRGGTAARDADGGDSDGDDDDAGASAAAHAPLLPSSRAERGALVAELADALLEPLDGIRGWLDESAAIFWPKLAAAAAERAALGYLAALTRACLGGDAAVAAHFSADSADGALRGELASPSLPRAAAAVRRPLVLGPGEVALVAGDVAALIAALRDALGARLVARASAWLQVGPNAMARHSVAYVSNQSRARRRIDARGARHHCSSRSKPSDRDSSRTRRSPRRPIRSPPCSRTRSRRSATRAGRARPRTKTPQRGAPTEGASFLRQRQE